MIYSSYRLLGVLLCTLLGTQVHATPVTPFEERFIFEAYQASKVARELSERDVVAPPIIKPDATSVWPIGTVQEVTWDISDLPPDNQITNPMGRVILGRDTGDSLNLDLDNPLAQGFHIRLGRINITVPNVPPRPDYLIVLMGNSGNTSPSFAITQISGGADTPPSLSSSSSSVRPPFIDPTPSLPGIVPTRSSRPAVVSPSATDIVPTTIITPSVSDALPTTSMATSDVSVSSEEPSSTESPSSSSASSATEPIPSDANQEDEGSSAYHSVVSIIVLMGAALSGLLVIF